MTQCKFGVLAALALAAAAPAAHAQQFPTFGDPRLTLGREIWLGTCQVCHTADFSGAPMVTDKGAWAPRIGKGKDALYASALKGLVGPKGTEMPARGGNSALTDDQVKAAVDYMVAIVSQ
jgi:cytochrome c5